MVDVFAELEALKAELAAERAARLVAEAKVSSIDALIASLKLQIEKLRRELYGQRSERKARLLDQMELELEELEASATEDELEAEMAAAEMSRSAGAKLRRSGMTGPTFAAMRLQAGTTEVKAFTRKKPSKKPFPEHLPRERVVIPGPTSCDCCGSTKLSKLGEDVTETLEVIPRQWKVIQYVREKFTCRPKAIDWARASRSRPHPFMSSRAALPARACSPLVGARRRPTRARVLFEKYGVHQPLNRQSERYAKEGVDLSLSTPRSFWGRPGRRMHGGAQTAGRSDRSPRAQG